MSLEQLHGRHQDGRATHVAHSICVADCTAYTVYHCLKRPVPPAPLVLQARSHSNPLVHPYPRTPIPRSPPQFFKPAAMAATNGSASKPTIGFLGLGIMGEAMARNVLKSGLQSKLVIWNRTASKVDASLIAASMRYACHVVGAAGASGWRSILAWTHGRRPPCAWPSMAAQAHCQSCSENQSPHSPANAHHHQPVQPICSATHPQCDALVSEGALMAATPAELVAQCDITFAMLADPAAALNVRSSEAALADLANN